MISFADALLDPALLGRGRFADPSSWGRWLTVARALYAANLGAEDARQFCQLSGRTRYSPPPGGWKRAAILAGRGSGKSSFAAAMGVYEVAIRAQTDPPRGGDEWCLIVAQDSRSARRAAFSAVREQLSASPLLAQLIAKETQDMIELSTGVHLACLPCRSEALRGYRARALILDELNFFRGSDDQPLDREVWTAAVPCTATTNGRVIGISSAGAPEGLMFAWHESFFGDDSAELLVLRAPSWELNPTLSESYLAAVRRDDPELFDSEFGAQFRRSSSTLLDPEAIDRAVTVGVTERPPVPRYRYRAAVDPSGGRRDRFSLAIGHREGRRTDARAVLDRVVAWDAPFNPQRVTAQAAHELRRYAVSRICGDRYAGEWPVAEFRRHGISYHAAKKTTSENLVGLVAAFNSGRVELLDDDDLVNELKQLRRRVSAGGRERAGHARGGHDDRSAALAALTHSLLNRESVIEVCTRGLGSPTYRSDGLLVNKDGHVLAEFDPRDPASIDAARAWADAWSRGYR